MLAPPAGSGGAGGAGGNGGGGGEGGRGCGCAEGDAPPTALRPGGLTASGAASELRQGRPLGGPPSGASGRVRGRFPCHERGSSCVCGLLTGKRGPGLRVSGGPGAGRGGPGAVLTVSEAR